LVPAVIFAIILRSIDLDRLIDSISQANPLLALLGVFYHPLVVSLGAWRWQILVGQYFSESPPWRYMIKHYWIGLAIGRFTPSSVGWDLYRVMATGRPSGRYMPGIAALFAEKALALLSCLGLVLVLYPFMSLRSTEQFDSLGLVMTWAYFLFVLCVVGLVLSVLLFHLPVFSCMCAYIENCLARLMQTVARRLKVSVYQVASTIPIRPMLRRTVSPSMLVPGVGLSLLIQFVAAFGNQVFFRALGYEIPFLANLFVTPLLFLIFLLPISFGSVGVREGSYILLYGLFGVPSETALTVSFFNLAGIVLNNAIGALLILTSKPSPGLEPEAIGRKPSDDGIPE
jgi:hypothetical protein